MTTKKPDAADIEAPHRTEKPAFSANVNGFLFAIHAERGEEVAPILTHFVGFPDVYVVCCRTEDELRQMLGAVGILRGFEIKQITDTEEFVSSLPAELEGRPLKIIFNVRSLPGNRMRWNEILREVA